MLIKSLTAVSVLLIIFVIVAMLTIILIGGWKSLTWEFISEFPREGMTKGGIFPAIVGTAIMTLVMTVAAVPFGAITAIYLAEYASDNRLTRWVRMAIVNLADLFCSVRNLDYDNREWVSFNLAEQPSWEILQKYSPDFSSLDVERFCFELDERVEEIEEMVRGIFEK